MNEKGLERLQALMNEVSEWSDKQFNKGIFSHERSLPIAHHLKKESEELIEALSSFFITIDRIEDDDLNLRVENIGEELADVFMLLLDCATHMGYDADDLVTAAYNKLRVNINREWGAPDDNGVVEHIRKNQN